MAVWWQGDGSGTAVEPSVGTAMGWNGDSSGDDGVMAMGTAVGAQQCGDTGDSSGTGVW